MKILMIAPYTGGIDLYVSMLTKAMTNAGHRVDIAGSVEGETAYDTAKKGFKDAQSVLDVVARIVARINFDTYDVVCLHYGKNDIEMLIPTMIDKKKFKSTKFIYYVHFLSRNLFQQYIPDVDLQEKIEQAVYTFFDGYVFFGDYAKKFMEKKTGVQLNGVVSFLPETHSQVLSIDTDENIENLITDFNEIKDRCVILPGFAANYKDHELLLESFQHMKNKMVFIFAGPGWRKRIPDDVQIGPVSVRVIDKYLSPLEYKLTVDASLFGVFPYRQPEVDGEYFQGSGAVPNFVYAGKSSIVLNEGAMPEYVGDSGLVLEKGNPVEFARCMDLLLSDEDKRRLLESRARKRTGLFSIEKHASDCLSFFEALS